MLQIRRKTASYQTAYKAKTFDLIKNKLQIKCVTQVHGLLRGICWDAIKHDAGQHGTEQQGKTAGNPLNTGEGAARWPVDHRIPEVSVTEIPRCLVEEQITGKNKKPSRGVSGGWLLIRKISNFSNFITGKTPHCSAENR